MRACALIVVAASRPVAADAARARPARSASRYLRDAGQRLGADAAAVGRIVAAVIEVKAPLASPLWASAWRSPAPRSRSCRRLAPPGSAPPRSLVAGRDALLFLRDGLMLFEFLVAVLGRLPIVTPFWVYPAFSPSSA